MSLLPVVLLLVLAEGLRRGRRFAWWARSRSTWCSPCSASVLALLIARTPAERLVAFGGARTRQSCTWCCLRCCRCSSPCCWCVTRRCSPCGAGRRHRRARGAAAALGAVAARYVLVGSAASRRVRPGRRPRRSCIADLPTRFLPPGYLGEVEPAFLPDAPPRRCCTSGPASCSGWSSLAAMLRHVRRRHGCRRRGRAAAARELLVDARRHVAVLADDLGRQQPTGSPTTAAPPSPTGSIGRSRSPPGIRSGPPADRADAVDGFAAFCPDRGWTPCLYSIDRRGAGPVTDAWAGRGAGRRGDRAAAGRLAFTGKKWQDVRTALNRAGKAGITARVGQLRPRRRWRSPTRSGRSPRSGWPTRGCPRWVSPSAGSTSSTTPRCAA